MKRTLLAVAAALTLAGGLAAWETAPPYQALNPNDQAAATARSVRFIVCLS